MGIYVMKLPDVGEGIAEAEIVEWAVKPGDSVREDDVLGAVMTDKASVEIPSPVAGVVTWLGADIGDMLAVGSDFAKLEIAGEGNATKEEAAAATRAPAPDAGEPKEETEKPTKLPEQAKTSPPIHALDSTQHTQRVAAKPGATSLEHAPRLEGTKPIASPAVRRRADDAGVSLRYVRGTGPAGRIQHSDLDAYLMGSTSSHSSNDVISQGSPFESVKVVGLRRKIAERMQQSKQRIPHFSYVEEVDVTELEALRNDLNETREDSTPKLSILPFIIIAVTRALREYPQMNARFDDDAGVLQRFASAHVGIATQTADGLMVPVIHNASRMTLYEIAAEIARLATTTREGGATRNELTGSTITVSSLGRLGGIVSTPVINYPEVAIVGVNKISTRPTWIEGRVVPRELMNLSSSFDHRVVDGADAASFIHTIKNALEHPAKLFMDT